MKGHSLNGFCKPSKLYYHHLSDSSSICSFPSFCSANVCERLISLCEEEGFKSEDDQEYHQSTFDLEVDASPKVREYLVKNGFVPALCDCMMLSHGTSPVAFDDVFVVKYDATKSTAQKSLNWHYDAGNVSFMLALSGQDSYEGGGTAFDVLQDGYDEGRQHEDLKNLTTQELAGYFLTTYCVKNKHFLPLHLCQGELLVFDAKLYHSGLQIFSGTRYILVGFCDVIKSDNRITDCQGNVGLDLVSL